MSLSYKFGRLVGLFTGQVTIVALPDDISCDVDIEIPMRDGKVLRANLYRPTTSNDARPVIMCAHPYSKDNLPKAGWFYNQMPRQYRLIRMPSRVTMSEGCSWEAPDPAFWVPNGFNVVNLDLRGFHKSSDAGKSTIFCDKEAEDYYDAIEWVAKQAWCNGKVGLCGVSYLAISQYKVAALNPPHLAAICPWEGFSDFYKDMLRPGGIRESGFASLWFKHVDGKCSENLPQLAETVELRNDEFYLSKTPKLEDITVPALICMSFSDQFLHTGGSFRVFRKISSQQKWLWTHRDGKWCAFYSDEAKALQLKFFEHFLMGKHDNGMLDVPRVRIEVRDRGDHVHSVRNYKDPVYPTNDLKWQTFHLNGDGTMSLEKLPASTACFKLLSSSADFRYQFEADSIIDGPMKLSLVISSEKASDMNLMAFLRKIDSNGHEVFFEGTAGYGEDVVTKGWQRVALRKPFDSSCYSEPWDCDKPFDELQPLPPNVPTLVTLQLLPSSTFFEKGSSIVLQVYGKFIYPTFPLIQVFNYEWSKTDDEVKIHCGPVIDSDLNNGVTTISSSLTFGLLLPIK